MGGWAGGRAGEGGVVGGWTGFMMLERALCRPLLMFCSLACKTLLLLTHVQG